MSHLTEWDKYTECEARKERRRKEREDRHRYTGWYPLKRKASHLAGDTNATHKPFPSPPAIVIEADIEAGTKGEYPAATLSAYRFRHGIDFGAHGTIEQLRELRDALNAKIAEIEAELGEG